MPNRENVFSSTSIAIEKLRGLIFSGQLSAGSDHLESELATRLGMSRTPVREALLRLEAQGLLEVRPRKGVRITPLSPRDMAEIYDVLTELESLAVANAASRGLTNDDLMVLDLAINDMDAALVVDQREDWAEADDVFHKELVRLGDNNRLRMLAEMMSDQVRHARLVTLYMRPTPTKSNDDHRQVVDAIRAGDAVTAQRTHRQHRIAAKEILIGLLDRHHLSSV
jgi:DNA-binding GntR family transcriptional regulator